MSTASAEVDEPPSEACVKGSSQYIFKELRGRILNGQLRAGAPLSQVQLASEFGVSRTPLREALGRLQAEGLIITEHNRRARVNPIDADELETIYAARICLESLAVSISVGQMTQKDLDAMAMCLDHAAAATDDYEDWERAHSQFHQLTRRYTLPPMRDLLGAYEERTHRYRRFLLYEQHHVSAWQAGDAQHRAILDACANKDSARSRRLVAHHLSTQALHMLTALAPTREPALVRAALQAVTVE